MMVRERNERLTKYKHTKSERDWMAYKEMRDLVTAAVRKEKSQYLKYIKNPLIKRHYKYYLLKPIVAGVLKPNNINMRRHSCQVRHTLSRADFFNQWRAFDNNECRKGLVDFIMNKLSIRDITENSKKELKLNVSRWSAKISPRWKNSSRKMEIFLTKYKVWLNDKDIEFIVTTYDVQPPTSSSGGRPVKSFDESSEKSTRRKIQHLLQGSSASELSYAAEVSIRAPGSRNAASIKRSYTTLRKKAISAGYFLYPSYKSLQNSKRACCPPDEFLKVTETSAEISLQAILDLTVQSLFIVQDHVV
nr:unnamed protein product [Callosobruchus analis]